MTWTSLETGNLTVQRLLRYALLRHSYHMPKRAWSSFAEYIILSLSLIPGQGDGSPPRSSPGSPIGVLGRFDSDLAMTPATPGRVLGSVTPDALPSHQHHCNVDKWRSLNVRCGADRPPTMENGPCISSFILDLFECCEW